MHWRTQSPSNGARPVEPLSKRSLPFLMSWRLSLGGAGALVASTWTPVSCSQVCLRSCLLLHGRALSGHAGARQHPGPDHRRHRRYDLLDLHHLLHVSQKVEAVTCLLTSARPKKLLLYSHLCSCAERCLGWVLSALFWTGLWGPRPPAPHVTDMVFLSPTLTRFCYPAMCSDCIYCVCDSTHYTSW